MKKILQYVRINSWEQFNNFFQFTFQNLVADIPVTANGLYYGTGIAGFDILTGFTPELVIITTDTNLAPVLWQKNMPIPHSKTFDGVVITDGVIGLSPQKDGFRLGTSGLVNTLAIVYRWTALGK